MLPYTSITCYDFGMGKNIQSDFMNPQDWRDSLQQGFTRRAEKSSILIDVRNGYQPVERYDRDPEPTYTKISQREQMKRIPTDVVRHCQTRHTTLKRLTSKRSWRKELTPFGVTWHIYHFEKGVKYHDCITATLNDIRDGQWPMIAEGIRRTRMVMNKMIEIDRRKHHSSGMA